MAVALLVAAQHGLDELEQLPDLLHVLRRHLQHGSLAETHVHRQRRRKVDLNLIDERLGEGQEIGRGVRRALHRADDAVGVEEDDGVGPDMVVLHVDRHGGLARHHDDGREAVDGGRVVGRRVVLRRKGCNHQIVRQIEHVAHFLFDPRNGDFVQSFAPAAGRRLRRFAVLRHVSRSLRTKITRFDRKSKNSGGETAPSAREISGARTHPGNTRQPLRPEAEPHRAADAAPDYLSPDGGQTTRSPPGRHSMCSGKSAPFCPSTSVGSATVERISSRRACRRCTIFGLPPSR